MKKLNILVTAIGGPTALGIIKCLRENDEINIVGIDCRAKNAGRPQCHKFVLVSSIDKIDLFKKEIEMIVVREQIDMIFPTLQSELKFFEEFALKTGIKVAIPKTKDFNILLNKYLLYKNLEELGISNVVPKYFLFHDNKELQEILSNHFPKEPRVCVKNAIGHGGIGVIFLADKKAYLQEVYNNNYKFIKFQDYLELDIHGSERLVMEYLDGQEYSVDLFLHNNKTIIAITRRRERVSNGIVIEGVVEEIPELIRIASLLAEKIVDSGFINLQFIYGENGYKLTDLNARYCGSQVMSLGAGVNFPLLNIECELYGKCLKPKPKWNTKMIRYWDSIFYYD
jgi:carbamoyl-phosphate synthase large subunit